MKTANLLLSVALGLALWPLWFGPGILIVYFVLAAIVAAFGFGRASVR